MNTKASMWILILLICLTVAVGGCAKVDASENDHANNNSVPEPGTIVLLIAGLIVGGAILLGRSCRKK